MVICCRYIGEKTSWSEPKGAFFLGKEYPRISILSPIHYRDPNFHMHEKVLPYVFFLIGTPTVDYLNLSWGIEPGTVLVVRHIPIEDLNALKSAHKDWTFRPLNTFFQWLGFGVRDKLNHEE